MSHLLKDAKADSLLNARALFHLTSQKIMQAGPTGNLDDKSRQVIHGMYDEAIERILEAEKPTFSQKTLEAAHARFEEASSFSGAFQATRINDPWVELYAGARMLQCTRSGLRTGSPSDTKANKTSAYQSFISNPSLKARLNAFAKALKGVPGIDPKSTIAYGPPGSWFFCCAGHENNGKWVPPHINVDATMACLCGFEPSEFIAKHEIGHASDTYHDSRKRIPCFGEALEDAKKYREKKDQAAYDDARERARKASEPKDPIAAKKANDDYVAAKESGDELAMQAAKKEYAEATKPNDPQGLEQALQDMMDAAQPQDLRKTLEAEAKASMYERIFGVVEDWVVNQFALDMPSLMDTWIAATRTQSAINYAALHTSGIQESIATEQLNPFEDPEIAEVKAQFASATAQLNIEWFRTGDSGRAWFDDTEEDWKQIDAVTRYNCDAAKTAIEIARAEKLAYQHSKRKLSPYDLAVGGGHLQTKKEELRDNKARIQHRIMTEAFGPLIEKYIEKASDKELQKEVAKQPTPSEAEPGSGEIEKQIASGTFADLGEIDKDAIRAAVEEAKERAIDGSGKSLEQAAIEADERRGSKAKPSKKQSPTKAAGTNSWLDEIPIGDINDYKRSLANEWRPAVLKTVGILKQLLQAQATPSKTPQPKHMLLPEEGKAHSFNRGRFEETKAKAATGGLKSINDFKFFKNPQKNLVPPTVNICMGIDSSGSNHGNSFLLCIRNAIIIGEAAKLLNQANAPRGNKPRIAPEINIIAGIWGAKNPTIIWSPAIDEKTTQERLSGLIDAQGGSHGTDHLEEFYSVCLETERDLRQPKGTKDFKHGATHFMVYTDGYLYRAEKDIQHAVEATSKGGLTIDFAATQSDSELFDIYQSNPSPSRNVSIHMAQDENKLHHQIFASLRHRVTKSQSLRPMLSIEKKNKIKAALKTLEPHRTNKGRDILF